VIRAERPEASSRVLKRVRARGSSGYSGDGLAEFVRAVALMERNVAFMGAESWHLRAMKRSFSFAVLAMVAACGGEPAPDDEGAVLAADLAALSSAGDDPSIAMPPGQWTWVPLMNTTCRDGSSTGVAVNPGATAQKLVIFLQAGGACYNLNTCQSSYGSFGLTSFNQWKDTNGKTGVFDRGHRDNPLHDYTFVFVPYCSGDLHAGQASNVMIPGISTPQHFAGYSNLGIVLQHIVHAVPKPDVLVLAGDSAGGFGATLNFLRVQEAFPSTSVTLLDDSGPMLGAEFVNPCLLDRMRGYWNVDATVLADCGAACAVPGAGLSTLLRHVVASNPKSEVGFVSSWEDETIRMFLGLAEGNCVSNVGYPADKFRLALTRLREEMAPYPNFDSFYVESDQHTFINLGRFYTTTSDDGEPLTAWMRALLARQVGAP
jgi:hypothetical protein